MKCSLCFAIAIAIERYKPYIAIFMVQVIYAGMALFSKAAIAKGMNPYVFVAYRQAFATLFLLPFAFFFERKNSATLSYKLLGKIFFISFLGITLSLNLYYFSINYTSATFAAASTNTIPAITFLMAVLLRMESISIKQWHGRAKVFGSILGVTGAFVFALVKGPPLKFMTNLYKNKVLSPNSMYNSKEEWVKGCLIMVLANIFWSLWLIMQALVVKQYPAKLRLVSLQCFFSCIQSTTFAMAMETNISSWKLGWDINLLSVAYCGIVVTGISYWLQLCAIEEKGAVFTALFTPLALIITIIFSWFLWKEILHWGSVCGAVLLVGGLYFVLWGKNREVSVETKGQKTENKEEIMLECIKLAEEPRDIKCYDRDRRASGC